LTALAAKSWEVYRLLNWRSAVWSVNAFFLLMTLIVAYLPHDSDASRRGLVRYLAQFTLAEEKNLATYWEGLCLLLVSILAIERFFKCDAIGKTEKQGWLGLSVLAAGLSLDELGSIHERTPGLFYSWGLTGSMVSKLPLAVPLAIVVIWTLHGMRRLPNRRSFWLTLSAFLLFVLVVFQEYLEFSINWPGWMRGVRLGFEEGTELAAVFCLLAAVLRKSGASRRAGSIVGLIPAAQTVVRMRPWLTYMTLVSFIPLGILSLHVLKDGTYRGIPSAWLPFVLLNLASGTAWAYRRFVGKHKKRFLLMSCLALFFALDQIIVFERIFDRTATYSALGILMFPTAALLCLTIPPLRARPAFFVLLGAFLFELLLIFDSTLMVFVMPIQCWAIFSVLAYELERAVVRGRDWQGISSGKIAYTAGVSEASGSRS
jgi:hypothetical protein